MFLRPRTTSHNKQNNKMRNAILTILGVVLIGTASFAQQENIGQLVVNNDNPNTEVADYSFTASLLSTAPDYTFDENFNIKEKSVADKPVESYNYGITTYQVGNFGIAESSKPLIGQIPLGKINVGKLICWHPF